MLNYCLRHWNANRDKLEDFFEKTDAIYKRTSGDDLDGFIKNVLKIIFGSSPDEKPIEWNFNDVFVISTGGYTGTVFFIFARKNITLPTDFVIGHMYYGSCSVCDSLEHIKITSDKEKRVRMMMILAKELVSSIVKPYNHGWMYDKDFDVVEDIKNRDTVSEAYVKELFIE